MTQKQKIVTVLGGYHNGEKFPTAWEATHLYLINPGPFGGVGNPTPVKHLIVWDESGWYALHPITGPTRYADIISKTAE